MDDQPMLTICNQCDRVVNEDAAECPDCETDNGLMDLSVEDAEHQLAAAEADGTDTGLGGRWSVLREFVAKAQGATDAR